MENVARLRILVGVRLIDSSLPRRSSDKKLDGDQPRRRASQLNVLTYSGIESIVSP